MQFNKHDRRREVNMLHCASGSHDKKTEKTSANESVKFHHAKEFCFLQLEAHNNAPSQA